MPLIQQHCARGVGLMNTSVSISLLFVLFCYIFRVLFQEQYINIFKWWVEHVVRHRYISVTHAHTVAVPFRTLIAKIWHWHCSCHPEAKFQVTVISAALLHRLKFCVLLQFVFLFYGSTLLLANHKANVDWYYCLSIWVCIYNKNLLFIHIKRRI